MSQELSITAAFSAGFLSFLAPCILPLLPPYFAWLLGVSQKDLQKKHIRLKVFLASFYLVLGFSIVFVVLGASASFIGQLLAPQRLLLQRIGGLLLIFWGLEFIGFLTVFKNMQVNFVKRLFSRLNHTTGSFFVGMTFAFAWVACFSPILGTILFLSSVQATLSQGVILLSFYSVGLAIPFLLAALFLGFLIERMKAFSKIIRLVNLFSGLILIPLGILLFTDNFYKIVAWLSKTI